MEHSLVTLFNTYAELDNPPIIELLDINNKPIGALYLDKLRYRNFSITDTNTSEKYYLYIDGIGLYFSFFKKINL
jgi:hypothetical protein